MTEVANELGAPKSTAYNHLQTLRQQGYVHKGSGRYQLSLKFLSLGENKRQRIPLYEFARSEIEDLADTTGANAYLTVEEKRYGIIIYRHISNDIELGDEVGSSMPLTSTAAGKPSWLNSLTRKSIA